MTDDRNRGSGGRVADGPLADVERIIGAAATKLARDLRSARQRGEHSMSDAAIDAFVSQHVDSMAADAVPKILGFVHHTTQVER